MIDDKQEISRNGWRCRVCGHDKYIHYYDTFYCASCSTVFKNIWMFGLESVNVKFLSLDAVLPKRAKEGDVGYDLVAIDDTIIFSGQVEMVHTGIAIKLPNNTEAQIRTRSGLGKDGIIVANSPGTIDTGYTGEICVLLHNTTTLSYQVHKGDRIAQMLITTKMPYTLNVVDELPVTDRGSDGFGSTGIKTVKE